MILDSTGRFDISSAQPENINDEYIKIYNPTISYYKTKYHIQNNCQVMGLFIGSRGTVPKF